MQAIVAAQFFLFGARRAGKTHLLPSLFKNHESVLWIDLLRQGEVLGNSLVSYLSLKRPAVSGGTPVAFISLGI